MDIPGTVPEIVVSFQTAHEYGWLSLSSRRAREHEGELRPAIDLTEPAGADVARVA